jgi:hypothetical protein
LGGGSFAKCMAHGCGWIVIFCPHARPVARSGIVILGLPAQSYSSYIILSKVVYTPGLTYLLASRVCMQSGKCRRACSRAGHTCSGGSYGGQSRGCIWYFEIPSPNTTVFGILWPPSIALWGSLVPPIYHVCALRHIYGYLSRLSMGKW